MMHNTWKNLLLICVGVVVGSLVADMTSGISWLSWLSYGLDFGMQSPLVVDLNALKLTLGISVNISISTIIFVLLALKYGGRKGK